MKPGYVYVASSWRNPMQTGVSAALRSAGIDHYDFKNPPNGAGFGWREVRPCSGGYGCAAAVHIEGCFNERNVVAETTKPKGTDWEHIDDYLKMVEHPRAIEGFDADFSAMVKADTFVLVLPCGKSAHLKLGWAVGAGKRTAILLEDPVEPELMYRMVDYMAPTLFDLLGWLGVED